MLNWLKTILGDAYTDEIDKKVSDEIGKGFVARADFNAVNEAKKQLEADLKERNTQLETLKTSTGDVEALRNKITELQAQNTQREKENAEAIKALKMDNAVEMALMKAGAKNTKAVKALLDLTKATLGEDGTVAGLADQIEKLTKADDSSFLFDTSKPKPGMTGMTPNSGGTPGAGGTGGKLPKDMNYDELCAYLAANPAASL